MRFYYIHNYYSYIKHLKKYSYNKVISLSNIQVWVVFHIRGIQVLNVSPEICHVSELDFTSPMLRH